MPDTKITALTALTAADPANDVLPIVDVSDTTMAASGTTKKISINNVLGCSGTATLASATITGNLTVDTNTLFVDSANNRVGVGTATPNWLLTASGSSPEFVMIDSGANGTRLYTKTTNTAVFIGANYSTSSVPINFTLDGGSSNSMTLNSTGLGVGVSPTEKLSVNGNASFSGFGINAAPLNPVSTSQRQARFQNTGGDFYIGIEGSVGGAFFTGSTAYAACLYNAANTPLQFFTNGALRATIDTSGNLILQSSATPATLTTNGQLTVNATSNTNLRFSYRGSDGVTRVANITLA